MITNFASANTILQTLADDDKRGRVMSFFSMSFVGMTQFGALISWAVSGPGFAADFGPFADAGSLCGGLSADSGGLLFASA